MKKIILLMVCLLLANCATIIKGSTRSVSLQSSEPDYKDPIKVKVINNNFVQSTTLPNTVFLTGGSGATQVIVKDKCFRETTTVIDQNVNPWIIGNIFVGFIGTSTDYLTGAMWTYDENVTVRTEENGVCRIK